MQWDVGRTGLVPQGTELIEHQLHTDPHEFHQLGVGAFVRLGSLFGVHGNVCDLGQVAHDLTDVTGQACFVLDDARSEAV